MTQSHWLLAALLCYFFCFTAYTSLHTPAFEAPDEYYHFAVIEHLARTGQFPARTLPDPITDYQFPAQPWRQMAFHAPLYYQLMAGLLRVTGADTADFPAYRLNPHAQIGVALAQDNHNLIAHRGGPVLLGVPLLDRLDGTGGALRGLRLASVALATWTLTAIYGFARAGWPHLPQRVALLAALLVALMPQYVFLGGIVSNDVLLTALAASGLWLVVWAMRQPNGRWWLPWVAGVLGGAAALTKASGVGVVALLGGLMVVQIVRQRSRAAWRGALIYGVLVLLIAGPWYLGNWIELGDLTGASWVARATGLRGGLPVTGAELLGLYWSFWGLFGWFNVALPSVFYTWTVLLTSAVGVGWLAGWRGLHMTRNGLLLGGVLAAYSALIVGAWWQFNQLTLAAQGRLLYPLLPIVAALMAVGLAQWPRWLSLPLVAGLAAASSLVPVTLTRAYAPDLDVVPILPDAVTVHLREPWRDQACVRLTVRLQQPSTDEAVLALWWQADCEVSGYWSVFLHAVDRDQQTCEVGRTDHILAQIDTMPQGGRLPLPRVPNSQAAYDVLRMQIPHGATHLHVGLYDAAGTGMRAFLEPHALLPEGFSTGQCAPELLEVPLKGLRVIYARS
ncbi:glycosyltransferase family 39 protein [Aggregatilineales bacterium SYSU G02658]